MAGTRTELRMLTAARDDLISAAFTDRPVFRMGYDAHVKAWTRAVSRECWVRYYRDAEFAAAYDARLGRRAA